MSPNNNTSSGNIVSEMYARIQPIARMLCHAFKFCGGRDCPARIAEGLGIAAVFIRRDGDDVCDPLGGPMVECAHDDEPATIARREFQRPRDPNLHRYQIRSQRWSQGMPNQLERRAMISEKLNPPRTALRT